MHANIHYKPVWGEGTGIFSTPISVIITFMSNKLVDNVCSRRGRDP